MTLLAAAAEQSTTTTTTTNLSAYRGLGPLDKQGIVLNRGPAAFDAGMVESPVIWWDDTEQAWGMVYVGYTLAGGAGNVASIGLAWSDNLTDWTKTGVLIGGSGIDGAPDEAGATGPYIHLEDGTYYLFYIGLTELGYEAGAKTLCVATASSIAGPWTRHGTIIAPQPGTWRANAIWHPSIVKVGALYYMFFNANQPVEVIGYATATTLTGPWTVDDTNSPVVGVSASGWDSQWVGDPSVYKVDSTWYMAYYGVGNGTAQDGLATTTEEAFPLGWTKHPGNPVLVRGVGGSIDATYAHKPFIVNHAGTHYHYYTAVGSAGRVIALATQT